MEFEIFTTSGKHYEYYVDDLKKYHLEKKVAKGYFEKRKEIYVVQINTLQEFISFCKDVGQEIIVRDPTYGNALEIYDNYRE